MVTLVPRRDWGRANESVETVPRTVVREPWSLWRGQRALQRRLGSPVYVDCTLSMPGS